MNDRIDQVGQKILNPSTNIKLHFKLPDCGHLSSCLKKYEKHMWNVMQRIYIAIPFLNLEVSGYFSYKNQSPRSLQFYIASKYNFTDHHSHCNAPKRRVTMEIVTLAFICEIICNVTEL